MSEGIEGTTGAIPPITKGLRIKRNMSQQVKICIPYYVGMFTDEFTEAIDRIKSPRELIVESISHSQANEFVFHHHYLHRRLYIARNVSYGLYAGGFCVGVAMFGYPVWTTYQGLVPPMAPAECPELLRLCTVGGLPKNSESWFIARCIKRMIPDWKRETGVSLKCITSFCDHSMGFLGALYRASNFEEYRKTEGRPANPGLPHGKWGANMASDKSSKTMYVYFLSR